MASDDGLSLRAAADALAADAIALRRRVHSAPELGLDLPRTQAAVLDALDGLGLEVRLGERTSSVVAILDGDEPGPAVLLRADMDALPLREDTGLDFASEVDGAMHACGHDAHTAMLAGAARLLAYRRGRLAGRVLFMFQPGEEGHHGARVMLEEGLVDPGALEAAYAIHQVPRMPTGEVATRPGPITAASDTLRITVTGRGGHASRPAEALDPVPIAAEIIVALQTLVTRQVDVFDPAVITIGQLAAGTAGNVIPETAFCRGTIRTLSAETRQRLTEAVLRLATGIAQAHGATATVEVRPGYPATVNDPEMAGRALAAAAQVVGEDAACELAHPSMGAEDFSYVLAEVPGAMVFLGSAPGGVPLRDVAPNHSNRMVLDEAIIPVGIALYASFALGHLVPHPAASLD